MSESLSVAPRHLRVQASGLTFAALEWGPEQGPLALCLHGYPDTAWTWRHLAPQLAVHGWRVVAPFMRGYGPTDLAPDGAYQVGALVRDAEELCAALGGDDRAVLIGHDWGAIAAYAVGAHRPDLFARIVTISVPPLPVVLKAVSPAAGPRALLTLARQARCSWYTLVQQVPGLSERLFDRIVRRLWADWSPGYDAREDLAYLFASVAEPGRKTAALRYYRANVQPWYQKREYAREQKFFTRVPPIPVLYLQGKRDGCLIPSLGEGALMALPPLSEAVFVDDAGHFVQLERPNEAAELITSFIGDGHARD